jgi:hypothetical protein
MLSVGNEPIMLSVVLLNVVAPIASLGLHGTGLNWLVSFQTKVFSCNNYLAVISRGHPGSIRRYDTQHNDTQHNDAQRKRG